MMGDSVETDDELDFSLDMPVEHFERIGEAFKEVELDEFYASHRRRRVYVGLQNTPMKRT